MSTPNDPSKRPRLQFTTAGLMVWVFAVATALGFLKSDWLPEPGSDVWSGIWLIALASAAILGTVFLIPWLSYQFEKSPGARRPPSAASRRFEHYLAVGCLGWLTAAVLMFGLLIYMILRP
jgi:hypothetical protein